MTLGPRTTKCWSIEGFATAFLTAGEPSFIGRPVGTAVGSAGVRGIWEAGYFRPGAAPIGATRLRVAVYPNGVAPENLVFPNIVRPYALSNDELTLQRVWGAAPDGTGGALDPSRRSGPPDGTSSFAYAFYEVVDNTPFVTETVNLLIRVRGAGNRDRVAGVVADFAPLTIEFEASGPAPEPRFVETAEPPAIPLGSQ